MHFASGRPAGMPATPGSIGQFGVGMKRALFKFGRHFVVRSATSGETWAVDVDVDKWEADPDDWHFKWAEFADGDEISKAKPGTDIVVDRLRPEVAARFATVQFVNDISGLIKTKHRQFIASGLSISVNDSHLDATSLYMLVAGGLQPGVETLSFGKTRSETVKVRIVVGVGTSSPREAGWYVICNGRVILEHDRRGVTGWGVVENEQGRTNIPSYHNQFAHADQDNPIWQKHLIDMIQIMRPVINFLNELDKDVEEFTSEDSPLFEPNKQSVSHKGGDVHSKGGISCARARHSQESSAIGWDTILETREGCSVSSRTPLTSTLLERSANGRSTWC